MHDEMIIALYEARDEQAIAETAHQYGRMAMSIAQRILGSREDAEECVSGAYLRLWNAIPPSKPRALGAYLGRIVRNLAFNEIERKAAGKRIGEVLPLVEELETALPAVVLDGEISVWIDRFLGGLEETNRRIFVRRYWFCDSIADLAHRFGLSEGAIKLRLHRMREELRTQLEGEGVDV